MFPVDIHLLSQAVVYFVAVITGLVTSISTGKTNIDFNYNCVLYGHVNWWENGTHFDITFGNTPTCNFVIYIHAFACVLFACAMGCYYSYATYRSRVDPAVGFQMWSLFFILSTSISLFLCFVASCILSVGFSYWCSSITSGAAHGANVTSCADGQTLDWTQNGTSYNGSHFYDALTSAQVASWFCFLAWGAQLTLTIIRWYRNKYDIARSSTLDRDEQDHTQFARAHPTA